MASTGSFSRASPNMLASSAARARPSELSADASDAVSASLTTITVVDLAVTKSHASSAMTSAAARADAAARPTGAQKGLRCRLVGVGIPR